MLTTAKSMTAKNTNDDNAQMSTNVNPGINKLVTSKFRLNHNFLVA